MQSNTDYMGPMKHILLATDGSEFSSGAVKEALYLAKSCTSKLSVIYVLEVNPEFETEGIKFVEKMELAAREHLDAIRKSAADVNVECDVIVRRTDQPFKAISEEAEKRQSDVVIMGRHGRTGLTKLLMGSVTAKVVGYSPCNVLIVPKDASIDCKKILVASDGSQYSNAAVSKSLDIAKRCSSSLVAVSVISSGLTSNIDADTGYTQQQIEMIEKETAAMAEGIVKNIKSLAEKEGVASEGIILGGAPYEAIVEAAKEKGSDLIVIGSHGRTGLTKLLMGSVAERVVGLAPCAVLVVKK